MTRHTETQHFQKPGRGLFGRPLHARAVTTERDGERVIELYVEGELVERRVEPIAEKSKP